MLAKVFFVKDAICSGVSQNIFGLGGQKSISYKETNVSTQHWTLLTTLGISDNFSFSQIKEKSLQ